MNETIASISAPLEGFKQTHIYQGQGVVQQVLEDMGGVALEAEARLQQRNRWGKAAGWSIGATIFALVVTIICAKTGAKWEVTGFMGMLLVASAIAAVVTSLVARHYRSLLIDQRMHQFVQRLVPLISADMAADAQIKIRLDLRPANHPSKVAKKGKASGWDVVYYDNPWLDLSGKFLDGTSFELRMLGKLQERSKTKRNARGKTKTKKKSKEVLRAAVQLWVKPQRYGKLSDLVRQAEKAVQLPEGVQVRSLEAQDDSIELEALAANWDASAPGESKGLV